MSKSGELSDPLTLIGEIAGTGQTVENGKYLLVSSLMEVELGLLQPDQLDCRQRVIEEELASGAMKTVTIEHLSKGGPKFEPSTDPVPLIGMVSTDIRANRGAKDGDSQRETQQSNLQLRWEPDTPEPLLRAVQVIPFDKTMLADMAAAWLPWGVQVDYAHSGAGLSYAIRPMADMVDRQLVTLRGLHHIVTGN